MALDAQNTTPLTSDAATFYEGKATTISGSDGDDLLVGSALDDILHGNAGNGTLEGGPGFDQLWGGEGALAAGALLGVPADVLGLMDFLVT